MPRRPLAENPDPLAQRSPNVKRAFAGKPPSERSKSRPHRPEGKSGVKTRVRDPYEASNG